MKRIELAQKSLLALLLFAIACIAASAQTFTSLATFNGTNGADPFAPVTQGTDGNFYGVTDVGGSNGSGVIFKITPSGTLTTLYSFCPTGYCIDGQASVGSLLQSADGNLYGVTFFGGPNDDGTVFKITPQGQLTTLYSFCSQPGCADGSNPRAGLIEASAGVFYGTTETGGNSSNGGTIFQITSTGKFTSLYSFCAQSGCTDGQVPYGQLTLTQNGNLFGTTSFGGGVNEGGTIFEFSPAGKFTVLHTFCIQSNCVDGQQSEAGLVQARNGSFYGTTAMGGTKGAGTIFAMTPSGSFTVLHSFCGRIQCLDGNRPYAGLTLATNGNLYGTTVAGGNNNQGTIFEMNPQGTLGTLYNFCSQPNCSDGEQPNANLIQSTNGTFYGTTESGGVNGGAGTVFSLSTSLAPFVEVLPTQGRAGSKVIILGNNLTTATSVTFNGTPAIFDINSDNEITASVPGGSSSGTVEVINANGTLASNLAFRIIK